MCVIRAFIRNPQMKIVIFLLVLLPIVELSKDNDKYCKCNPLHVLCDKGKDNSIKKQINDSPQRMQSWDRITIAIYLNSMRHEVARGASIFPQASDMQKLNYSEKLERAAEMQVKFCNPWTGFGKTKEWCGHECYKCTDIDGIEVHFSKSSIRVMGRENNIKKIITRLKKPPKSFIFDVSENYKVPSPRKLPSELNEIQYMALQSKYAEFGCAYTTYMEVGYRHYTLVCAFGPVTPGMTDQPLYKAETPCCHCPFYSRCSDKQLTSLCVYEPGKSFNRTEAISEDGSTCKDPETSGESKP